MLFFCCFVFSPNVSFDLTLVLFVSRNRFGRQEAHLSRNSFDLQECTRLLPTTKRKLGFGRFESCQSGIGIVVDQQELRHSATMERACMDKCPDIGRRQQVFDCSSFDGLWFSQQVHQRRHDLFEYNNAMENCWLKRKTQLCVQQRLVLDH